METLTTKKAVPRSLTPQECIPVGWVPSAAVAVSGGGGTAQGVCVPGEVCPWGGGLTEGKARGVYAMGVPAHRTE